MQIYPILRRTKNWLKSKTGKIAKIKKQENHPKKWYGGSYGGFYANPSIISQGSIVYSFGIGMDISFDLELIKKHGCSVFGFDPTPKSIDWIKKQSLPEQFHFFPFGIGATTDIAQFNLPTADNRVSGSVIKHDCISQSHCITVQLKSFKDICTQFSHTSIDVLKMDIEGSEYTVIRSILESGIPIRQILLEAHERFFKDGKKKTEHLFNLLNQHGYHIFAISDSYQEISLIRKDI